MTTLAIASGHEVVLEIPAEYTRTLSQLRKLCDIGPDPTDAFSDPCVYDGYRTVAERIVNWLLDQTKQFGYRSANFVVLGWSDNSVRLQVTDKPSGSFWVSDILQHLSDPLRFRRLLDAWCDDDETPA